ncbi:hypothetical protein [Thermoflavimicrobium dichotomicum]|uniref:Uncharacterized protein n=1 Tax=Thermoflavimicrobium dichotomicum TaxID=46223 RepID=A0A1I3VH17_9BACL|nr:hypothetical protein [Thermoflavimicrobium dichotomicum]SFJ82417.1 hypothetical protein SAMN05421852_1253 [Thermoflavimicrobium dichotomicum]SFJ94309.1 hypothetical protein SAMN05421852_1502 [Thermoflavimicrobium dichotomicum]
MQERREHVQYDKTYRIGGSIVHIVAPRISDEEREKRLEEVARVIWMLLDQVGKTKKDDSQDEKPAP